KANTNRFPILSILARRYLAIPATSAAIESVFSISNNIITKARNRLNPNLVSEIILLKSWMKDFKELENEYFEENNLD
ncbi:hypothetical protein M431DRAFT_102899, partial [Trichoderma harzianum CBS 226.95]